MADTGRATGAGPGQPGLAGAGALDIYPSGLTLLTLGVPIAAWCGVMLADLVLRRQAG